MPKLSQVLRDQRRDKLIKKHAARRAELRQKLQDATIPPGDKHSIQEAFAKLPRNSCPARRTRRCLITGRSRAVYRKFAISRIQLRELGHRGELPGVRKSSW
jgi:small subunit ribosomal protein S14